MAETLFVSPVVRAIGLALVHFLWQGALIAAAAACVLHGLRRSSATSRYLVGCLALAAMALAPVVTTSRDLGAFRAPAAFTDGVVAPADPASLAAASTSAAGAGAVPGTNGATSWVPFVVFAWLSGVAVMTVNLTAAWRRVRRMKRSAVPVDEPWRGQMAELVDRLGLARRIALAQSALVNVPTLIGWLRPVVIVPASVLAGLTPSQLDAILTHELAHVRRHDYLVNVLQTIVETLLFYHPAVWWVSRRVRAERELCCDDFVLAICGDRIVYARALASTEELRTEPPVLALAATSGPLLHRIRRILSPGRVDDSRSSAWSVLVGAAAMVPVFLVGGTAQSSTATARPSTALVADAAPVSAPTWRSLHFEYEVSRDDVLVGQPSVSTVSVQQPRTSLPGELATAENSRFDRSLFLMPLPGERPVLAAVSIAGDDAIALSLVPGGSNASVPPLTLRGADPVEASWISGPSTYRIRIRRLDVPSPSGMGAVGIGGSIQPPQLISRVDPVYPQAAIDANVFGVVIVALGVDEAGAVSSARVIRSVPMLDDAALDAVRQWEYAPATLNGQPVSVITSVNVTFPQP